MDEWLFGRHASWNVALPSRPAPSALPDDPSVRRMRLTWRLLAGSFALLTATGAAAVAVNAGQPLNVLVLVLIVAAAVAAVGHQRSVAALEAGRRAEAEYLARILQGLSRSASPDAVVEAIVRDLGAGTGADHTVVIRLRPDEAGLEATLVGARPGAPMSTTRLPLSDLDPDWSGGRELVGIPIEVLGAHRASRGGRSVFELPAAVPASPLPLGMDPVTARLGARATSVFGLSNTLVAPLRTDAGVIGAIVLSRRTRDAWPAAARRILHGAAAEASAALGRVESHRAAEARASTDVLTGLPNRRYFEEFCALLAHRRRADDAVGVLMIDIDHFKLVNDQHGHEIGDEVLRAVAGAIAGAVREGDVPARFGGEEFAVLLRNPSGRVAFEVGERVRAAVGALDLGASGVDSISVSVGVAVADNHEVTMAELLAEADRALYRAKRAGRDRVVAA